MRPGRSLEHQMHRHRPSLRNPQILHHHHRLRHSLSKHQGSLQVSKLCAGNCFMHVDYIANP